MPVGLCPHEFAAGPQRLELASHLAHLAADGFVRSPDSPVSGASVASTRQ